MTTETTHHPIIHPTLGIAIGIAAVSTASLIIKGVQDTGMPSLVIAALRLTCASLVLAPITLASARRRAELFQLTRRDALLAVGAGLLLGLHFATWITSLQFTSIASSTVFVSTAPLFVGVFSFIVWREKFGAWLIGGLILASIGSAAIGLADTCNLAGMSLTCPPWAEFSHGPAIVGDALALVGAGGMAGYLLIGRSLRSKLSLLTYIFLSYGSAAITLLIAAFVVRQPLLGYSLTAYAGIALLALVPQLVGHSAFNWALRYLSATYVSVTILGEPIGSTVLAYFIRHETPSTIKLIGGAMILVGILIASRR